MPKKITKKEREELRAIKDTLVQYVLSHDTMSVYIDDLLAAVYRINKIIKSKHGIKKS